MNIKWILHLCEFVNLTLSSTDVEQLGTRDSDVPCCVLSITFCNSINTDREVFPWNSTLTLSQPHIYIPQMVKLAFLLLLLFPPFLMLLWYPRKLKVLLLGFFSFLVIFTYLLYTFMYILEAKMVAACNCFLLQLDLLISLPLDCGQPTTRPVIFTLHLVYHVIKLICERWWKWEYQPFQRRVFSVV